MNKKIVGIFGTPEQRADKFQDVVYRIERYGNNNIVRTLSKSQFEKELETSDGWIIKTIDIETCQGLELESAWVHNSIDPILIEEKIAPLLKNRSHKHVSGYWWYTS